MMERDECVHLSEVCVCVCVCVSRKVRDEWSVHLSEVCVCVRERERKREKVSESLL